MTERSEGTAPTPNLQPPTPASAAPVLAFAGGGTGGHVIPALAVAREVCSRGCQAFFVGTGRGLEARLVPAAGFELERIGIGGLKRVGWRQMLKTLWQLPFSTLWVLRRLRSRRVAAVFSMGGYVAGPAVIAALLGRLPVVVMEPNAVPGFTNRRIGRFVARALLSFEETARWFPAGRTEITGLPVREEFFRLPLKPREAILTILVSGGSQGSRTLNRAARESWPLFRAAGFPVRFLHQGGERNLAELQMEFAASGLEGEVTAFIDDMPAAFARADLIVCRSGAGAVAELAAAGKPSILVPFPYAADEHQLRNAETLARAGAARLIHDQDMSGQALFDVVRELAAGDHALRSMGEAARRFAHPGAARRAAEILIQTALTGGRQP